MFIHENTLFNNRYLLKRKLGAGGFSEVWLAEDTKSNNMQVALKIYAVGTGLDKNGLKEFSNEYALVFNFSHPNLLRPTYYEDWNDMPFLVMQYMPSGSCMKLCGKMSEKELARFLIQIADALLYLHESETPIIHLDIKPDNILVDPKGNYLLTDFGISTKIRKTLTKSMGKPISNSGTTAYMAPERISENLSEREPIKANDIFSLGVTMFELLTDELPYGELGGMVANTGNKPARLPENFSLNLQLLIAACLSKETWKRPTAQEIKNSAESFLGSGFWVLPDRIERDIDFEEVAPPDKSTEEINNDIGKSDSQRKTEPIVFSNPENNINNLSPDFEKRKKTSKSKLKIIIGAFLFICVIFILVYFLLPNENRAWRSAIAENSKESFENFIGKYPKSKFVPLAQENILWIKTESENAKSFYLEFLKQYPESEKVEKAHENIERLTFDSILALNNRDFLRQFIQDCGDCSMKEEALQKLEDMLRDSTVKASSIEADINAFNSAKSLNTKAAYEQYLADYPEGVHAEDARKGIEEIRLFAGNSGIFRDSRSGNKQYKWVRIGTQIWMAENLNFSTGNGSWCFSDKSSSCLKFGRLYSWQSARNACPQGWHLPTDSEWNQLEQSAGLSTYDSRKTSWRGSHANAFKDGGRTGFNLTWGNYRLTDGSFFKEGTPLAAFWTSTTYDNDNAWYRYFGMNSNEVSRDWSSKGLGLSVRCVRN
ncbi:MAG: FISUMP domain-containing protein [Bacteroidales bacterium]|nr:FISUMP domain-containing protein [Bacteroidales bacterium]